MRNSKRILAAVIAAALLTAGRVQSSFADSGELISTSQAIEPISKAATASDVIAAYATAIGKIGESSSVDRAFLLRMVELDSPDLAESQATTLSGESRDGLSWGVLAYSSAKRGDLDTALDQISTATAASPNNEFILKTAGQIVALADARSTAGGAVASDNSKKLVANLHKSLAGHKQFDDAYSNAEKMLTPPAPPPDVPEGSGAVYVVSGDQMTTAYNGAVDRRSVGPGFRASPMALFYEAPYGLFPNYGYGYQPWAPASYGLLPGVTYYYDWLNHGVGPLFPFPTIDRDTRYLRLPGQGFALINGDGTQIYEPLNSNPYYFNGGYGGYYPQGNWNNRNGGRRDGWRNNNGPFFRSGQFAPTRLSARMGGGPLNSGLGSPFIASPGNTPGPVLGGFSTRLNR